MGGRNVGKISMQPIANNKARRVTFVKRKNGLKKKLHELTTLCDIEACMICFDGDDGTVETWPEDQRKFNGVIQKYKRVGRIEREKNCVDVDSQLEARKKKLEDSCGWDQRLDDLSKESLSELGCSLDCQLEKVRERVHQLNNLTKMNVCPFLSFRVGDNPIVKMGAMLNPCAGRTWTGGSPTPHP
ncbi:hypothetical protein IFM89_020343 [Coptis chinensis]|uniref:MADS-box domain-containing protein n=1 Tax=Coptis chinensis TaxID=261450 RepID=A0A835H7R1_9MAGN|nr:hypothetical protein IFM89_020343 [Coptis chinensis]